MMFSDGEIEKKLYKIWQTLLCKSEINATDDFFLSGGDDFLFSALQFSIEKIFNMNMPTDKVIFYQQVQWLREKTEHIKSSIIISLNKGSAKSPIIVFIHPIGGTVFHYKNLVNLLNLENPVYAIQDRFLLGELGPYQSIQEQAEDYINQFIALNIQEQFILSGLSSGGTLAFEMSRQLLKQGYKVKRLVMFDSWVKMPFNTEMKDTFKNIMLRQLNKLQPDLFFNRQFTLDDWLKILWERMQILWKYVPEKVPIDAVLLVPAEAVNEYAVNKESIDEWKLYVNQLEVLPALGNHETMLDKENIIPIKESIRKVFC